MTDTLDMIEFKGIVSELESIKAQRSRFARELGELKSLMEDREIVYKAQTKTIFKLQNKIDEAIKTLKYPVEWDVACTEALEILEKWLCEIETGSQPGKKE